MFTHPQTKFIVRGRVQGVGFRYASKRKAEQLGLSGAVKNLPNGDVEVIAQGASERLSELETWLWIGPDSAKVSDVMSTPSESGSFSGFTIL